jgi:hypothetical protein
MNLWKQLKVIRIENGEWEGSIIHYILLYFKEYNICIFIERENINHFINK